MKLHLPKGLRTALLAVVSLSSAYTVQAAPAAVFDKAISIDQWSAISTEDDIKPDIYHNLEDATSQDWVLKISAHGITPTGIGEAIRNASILTFRSYSWEEVTINNHKSWKITEVRDGMFGILITPDSDLVVAMCSPQGEEIVYRLEDKNNWGWSSIHNIEITLCWDAKTETLKMMPGFTQRKENGAVWNFRGTEPDGSIILPYKVDKDWFWKVDNPDNNLWIESEAGGYVNTTLYTQGTSTAWLVSGNVDLADLKGGVFTDKTTGNKRALVVGGTGDRIQFIGKNGVISTKEDAMLDNLIETSIDLKNPTVGSAVGFAAAKDTTLTLSANVVMCINNNEAARIPALNILGEGTVKLYYPTNNTGGLENIKVNVLDSATLELYDQEEDKTGLTTIITPTINLANGTFSSGANILKSGLNNGLIIKTDLAGKGASTTLNSIKAQTGNLRIQGAGSVTARELEAAGGSIAIDAKTQAVDVTASVAVDITADTTVSGTLHTGTLSIKTDEAVYDAETGTSTPAAPVSASIGNVDAVTVNVTTGADMSASLYAGSLSAGSVTLTDAATTAARITISRPATTFAAGANQLMTGARIDSTGISAASITNAEVTIAAGDTSAVTATSVEGANYTVGADQVITNATASQGLSVSHSRIAAGNLSADDVTLLSGQTLSATTLNADELTAGATTATKASLSNVVALTKNAAVVETVAAESATLAKGYNLTADTIEVDDLTVQDNVTINGATIRNSVTDLGSNVALNNVTIGDGTTLKAAALNMKQLAVSASFGGADGRSFTVDQTIDKLVLDGSTRGNDISLTHVTLNGEELDFSGTSARNQLEVALLTAEKGEVFFDDRPVNYTLNIQPYTRAELALERTATGDSLVIRGYDDEAGIKKEVSDTANRAAAIQAIAEVAETGGVARTLSDYVGHVHRYALADRKEVLSAISGASTVALADSQRSGLRDVQHNLRNRVIQLGGTSPQDSEWEYNGLQAWAQADGSFSSSDASGDEAGYDFDTYGATVGVNIDVSPNTLIGASFSASYGELDVDSADKATGNNDAMYYSFFARHQNERWVQMFILTYGQNEMDMERSVLGHTAKGDTTGTTLSAYYELGYTVGLNYEFTHILQPMVSLSLTSAKVDGYSESGTLGNAALDYDGDSYVYGTLGIGARYQGVIFQNVHDRNAVVEARALITKDFGDTTDEAQVAFAGTHKNFKVQGADTSGMGFELGAGISLPVEQHTTLFADADMTVRPDYTGFRANIGLRYDF